MVPAQAVLDQFELGKKQLQDPTKLGAWLPILGQYGPALLVQCKNALDLSKELVCQWLAEYMLAKADEPNQKAEYIAGYLSNHVNFKTHARHIDKNRAREIGLLIEDLEDDQEFQDLVLSAFHAMSHTFSATSSVKIIENHLGKAFIKHNNITIVPQ